MERPLKDFPSEVVCVLHLRGFLRLEGQRFGIEEPELFRGEGDMYGLGGAQFAVQIDGCGLIAADGQLPGAEVADQLGQLLITAALVFSDYRGNLQPGNFFTSSTSMIPSQGSAEGTGLKPPP